MADQLGGSADGEKLSAVLAERGLPAKLDAHLNQTERKIHALLCAAYNFETALVALEMPQQVWRRCGPELRKLWQAKPGRQVGAGKIEIIFTLTPGAIKTTLRTVLVKDAGILKARTNPVRLHESWTRYIKQREVQAAKPIDWSRDAAKAKRHNAQVTQQILDGKTFNAQKDNPWARKHLKNKGQ